LPTGRQAASQPTGYDLIFIAVGLCGITSVVAIPVIRRRGAESLANCRLVVALVASTLWMCGYWAAACYKSSIVC
jgi:hypothetical protein